MVDVVGERLIGSDIGLLFFRGRLKEFMRLAQRARHGGDGASALAELSLVAGQLRDAFEGVDLIADRFLQALREQQPLLGGRQRRFRFDGRARLVGGSSNQRIGSGFAQCADELTARFLGAPAAPAVPVDNPVEAGVRHAQHVRDVVDRRQSLFVESPRLFQHVRRDFPFGHDLLPNKKRAGKYRRVRMCVAVPPAVAGPRQAAKK